MEPVLVTPDDVLHGSHGTEGAPCTRTEIYTYNECYGSGYQTHNNKDHSNLVYDPLC